MKAEHWQRVKQLLDEAIGLNAVDRSSLLERECAGDSDLRREVESLLSSHDQAGTGFLNTPAVDLKAAVQATPTRAGRRIGPYQIVEQIGQGGMGEVYRAVRADGQYTKEVAVKLVRGGFDSAFIQERFRNERQILASLDHPNIARLLDGGTTEDGISYLVMELIEGSRIDSYCDEHMLSITQRLQLFRQVCGAVQYAHQRLVIHRDIKPSNILVTKEGIPKLLDFGIAKILDPAAGAENTLARPMTPEYASPEQIRGEPITTASDEYSLGVVLYQLLTGRSPYPGETRSSHELARAVCETEPGRPSTAFFKPPPRAGEQAGPVTAENVSSARKGSPAKLQRRLAGDLDDIVLKALRKEPQRRYASVEQFSEDLRRHLEGLPVAATKGSWRYRAGKFVRRHKVSVAATAAVTLALVAGIGATVREARIARQQAAIAQAERIRAEQRFNDVRKLANSLIFDIHDSIADLPGSTPARKLLVSRALEYLDSLSQQAKGDASLQKELATAYERVGDVLGYPYGANLGDSPGALQSYRKALAIRESMAAIHPDDLPLQNALVRNYFRIANVLEVSGDFSGALDSVRKAVPITQRLAAGKNDPVLADHLAGGYYYTAGLLGHAGKPLEALENYRRAAAIRQAALQADPTNVPLNSHLAGDYGGMALSLRQSGDLVQAIRVQGQAIDILQKMSSASPNNTTLREFLGEAMNRVADFHEARGDATAARDGYRRAHQIFQDLLTADPKNFLAKSNFAFSDNGIARSLIALGKPAFATGVYREAVATFESMPGSGDRYVRSGVAQSYSGLGQAYSALATRQPTSARQALEDWRQALSWYEKSKAIWLDKEKRGEFEAGEREDAQEVDQAIARCHSALARAEAGGNR